MWEYFVLNVAGVLNGDPSYPKTLNDLGRLGWEMVGMDSNKHLIFKRKVE